MLRHVTILIIYWLLTSFFVIGQTARDTSKSFNDGHLITYCKGNKFNSVLFINDTLTKDTIEVDKQVSQNSSISILYQNNKPKYKVLFKAYYDERAKETRKKKRHHKRIHFMDRINPFWRHRCFFPAYYYGKSAKIKSIKIYKDNKWKRYNDKTIKPIYVLFDSHFFIYTEAKF